MLKIVTFAFHYPKKSSYEVFDDGNSQFGFSYGQAVAFEKNQPIGSQQARILLKVDGERLWKMVEDYLKEL